MVLDISMILFLTNCKLSSTKNTLKTGKIFIECDLKLKIIEEGQKKGRSFFELLERLGTKIIRFMVDT